MIKLFPREPVGTWRNHIWVLGQVRSVSRRGFGRKGMGKGERRGRLFTPMFTVGTGRDGEGVGGGERGLEGAYIQKAKKLAAFAFQPNQIEKNAQIVERSKFIWAFW